MRQPTLARLVRSSAGSTVNLTVLLAVAGVGLWVGLSFLILASGWLYLLLIGRDVFSPRFAQRVLRSDAERLRRLPDSIEVSDITLRVQLSSIRSGYAEIARALKETPEPLKRQVRGALGSLQELQAHAAHLIREGDVLARHLRTMSREGIERELRRLSAALARAPDEARAEYDQALSVRRDQLAALEHLERQQARVFASLERIVGTIEAFPAWIYRLEVLERRAREDVVGDTDEELRHVDGDLSSTRRLLEGLGEVRAT